MSKPRIKRDVFTAYGFICRSREPEGFMGKHSITGVGDTIQQAYYNWRQKWLSDPKKVS